MVERLADLVALDPAEASLDLKILDPAMGSGHFLVTAVDFLSDYIAELVEYVPAVPEWLDGEYVSPLVGRVEAIRADIIRRARESDWALDESLAYGPDDHQADGAEAVHLRGGQEPADRGAGESVALAAQLHRGARRCRSWTTICGAGTR